MIELTEIVVYPIKGTQGLQLSTGGVEVRGLTEDRRWMLVDSEGHFLSQRTSPQLALLRAVPLDGGIRLEAPGQDSLEVRRPEGGTARVRVRIWDDEVSAPLAAGRASAWCSAWLGFPVRLVFMDHRAVRPVDPAYGRGEDRVSFADGFPVLLTGTASLDDLNARMEVPLPMNRFRPNLVVKGGAPYEEDTWRVIRIGDVTFRVVKPCKRCVVTTINQETAAGGKEPLRTLATFRKQGSGVLFGQNLIPEAPGTVRVGDPVTVEARR